MVEKAIKNGKPFDFMSQFDYSVPLTELGLIGGLAMRVGKKIDWNSAKLEVTGMPEAAKFIKRLKERTEDRDKPISVRAFRTQLRAIHAWGVQQPSDLSTIRQPVFVANGDHDRMVPTSNTVDLAKRLPNSELKIYPDAGHGGIFQFHDEFVAQALEFLAR